MWKLKWIQDEEFTADFYPKDKTVLEILTDCDKELYPNVKLPLIY